MRNSGPDLDLSDDQFKILEYRQREVYKAQLRRFKRYLKERGKEPKKEIGYPDKSVRIRLARFMQLVRWIWETEEPRIEISTEDGDKINAALASDTIRRINGNRYSEGSKRKFNDVLRNWFAFHGKDWEPNVTFSDERATNAADPYSKAELKLLTEAALTYKSIPTYDNITPEERDRWKAHIAQELGKPKAQVIPADWDRINRDWKVPSLIRSTRECGWRPDIVGRMKVDWYDSDTQRINIPKGEAPKNDSSWTEPLTDESAMMLENWLEQRENMELYDGRDEIWLTRKGNPYTSGTLNYLLKNLQEEAGIKSHERKLVWYSFRHSIGTYIYHEYSSLKRVAQNLRQNSIEAASRYVHPLPEAKREDSKLM